MGRRGATVLDDTATVVQLAVQVEDRDHRERGALLRVAHRTDAERNKNVLWNPRFLRYGPGMTPDLDVPLEAPSLLAMEAGCAAQGCRICERARKLWWVWTDHRYQELLRERDRNG